MSTKLLPRVRAGQRISEGLLNSHIDAINRLGMRGFGMVNGNGVFARTPARLTQPFQLARVTENDSGSYQHHFGAVEVTFVSEGIKGGTRTDGLTGQSVWNRGPALFVGQYVLCAFKVDRYEVISGWPQVYYGVTNTAHAKDTTAGVTFHYNGDTGLTASAHNHFAALASGTTIAFACKHPFLLDDNDSAQYEIIAAEC